MTRISISSTMRSASPAVRKPMRTVRAAPRPTAAGLAAARARGRVGGRRKQLDPEKRRLAVQLYTEKKHTVVEICRLMGISKPTLYSYVAEANG